MANSLLTIKTPKGSVYQSKTSNGKTVVKVEWNPGFGPEWTKNLNTVQAMFDEEVLRKTDPYVPMDTGLLKRSAMGNWNGTRHMRLINIIKPVEVGRTARWLGHIGVKE